MKIRFNGFQFFRSFVVSVLLLGLLIIWGCNKNNNQNSSSNNSSTSQNNSSTSKSNNIPTSQNNSSTSQNNSSNSSNSSSTPKQGKAAVEINRKSFSFSLPDGWTEEKDGATYNAESLVSFVNEDNGLFMVVIGKKSAGASLDTLLKGQKAGFQKMITDAKVTEFTKWGNYEGRGFEFEGMIQGILKGRARIFGFENAENICITVEYGTLDVWEKSADDFATIEKTFQLKSK